MAIDRAPPRLKHGDELGAILRAGDRPAMSAERLASSRDAVERAVAAGALSRLAWLELAAPLVVVVAAIAVQHEVAGDRGDGASSSEIEAAVVADIELPDVAVVRDTAPPAAASIAAPEPRVRTAAPAVTPPASEPPTTSDLPEQIRLYEAARAAGARGDFAGGIALIDELLRRFPTTQLRAEAELSRAELLTRGNHIDDAIAALEALAGNASHRGRRGELLRGIGDLHRKRGDCARALDAYTRARTSRLSAREKSKVDRGISRCEKAR